MTNQNGEYKEVKKPINLWLYITGFIGSMLIVHFLSIEWPYSMAPYLLLLLHLIASMAIRHNAIFVEVKN